MKFSTIAGTLSLASGILAAPAPAPAPAGELDARQTAGNKVQWTDYNMWSVDLPLFLYNRGVKYPSSALDWSSDGCTGVANYPYNWPFVNAGYRHDFGYRNYKAQGRYTAANKLRIDNKFLTE